MQKNKSSYRQYTRIVEVSHVELRPSFPPCTNKKGEYPGICVSVLFSQVQELGLSRFF
jgi:hypothetical protein